MDLCHIAVELYYEYEASYDIISFAAHYYFIVHKTLLKGYQLIQHLFASERPLRAVNILLTLVMFPTSVS
jgi:hypothetical protein